MLEKNYWSDRRKRVVYGNPENEIQKISDLREYFPKEKYMLILKGPLLLGSNIGQTSILSPSKKGQRQPVMYWNMRSEQ